MPEDPTENMRRMVENAIRIVNSPGFRAALETQQRNEKVLAQLVARAATGELQRQVAASASFIEAQQRMVTRLAALIATRQDLVERVGRNTELQNNSVRIAAEALSKWVARDDVGATLSRLVASAAERENSTVNVEADREEVEMLANAPAPSDEALRDVEDALALDPETELAVDAAASHLMVSFPRLSRAHARWLVVVLIFVASAGALVGATALPVLLAVLPGILGLDAPAAGRAAGRAFDRLLPPETGRAQGLEHPEQDPDAPEH